MRYGIVISFLLGSTLSGTCSGQVVDVECDLNVPAFSGPGYPEDFTFSADGGYAIRIGVLSQAYLGTHARGRWTMFVGVRSMDLAWALMDPITTRHTASAVEVGYDRLVWRRSWLCLSGGLSAGPVFVSHKDDFPGQIKGTLLSEGGGWVVSTCVKAEHAISGEIAIVVGLRGWILSRGRKDMFPFQGNPVFSIGLQGFRGGKG